jgi:nitrogen fixation-related uncharacterized protein
MNTGKIRRSLHRFSILLGLVIALLFLWTNASTGAEYYQWTDENGVLHISNMPPEETPKKQRRLKTTRLQEPAAASGVAGSPSASPPAPGAAPVGKTPGAPPPAAAVDAAKTAAAAPGTAAASQAPAGGSTTAGSPSASQAPSRAASSSEPFRSSQPPPDSTVQDADTAKGAVNTRHQ